MPLVPPLPDPVPFDEVADVLDRATLRARGGPMAASLVTGRQLAAALDAAGFEVVRIRPSAQLSL
jgi:hypothetical protein